MKWCALLLATVAVALTALFFSLAAVLEGEELRASIADIAVKKLGRPLHYGSLSVGLLPPRLDLAKVRMPGLTPGSPDLVHCDGLSLHIALWPLLQRFIVFDTVVITGTDVALDLTTEGLSLPRLVVPEVIEEEDSDRGFSVSISEVRISRSNLVFTDSRDLPARQWRLGEIEMVLAAQGPGAPIEATGEAQLAEGGSLSFDGHATASGAGQVDLQLEGLHLSQVTAYLQGLEELEAIATGSVEVSTDEGWRVTQAAVDLQIEELHLLSGPHQLDGGAELAGAWGPTGVRDLRMTVRPEGGGWLRVEGDVGSEGQLDLTSTFEELDTALIAGILPEDTVVKGRLRGRLAVLGAYREPQRIAGELQLTGSELRFGDFQSEGELTLAGEVEDPAGAPRGEFTLDLGESTLRHGAWLDKQRGVAASCRGQVRAPASEAMEIRCAPLRLGEVEARVLYGRSAGWFVEVDVPQSDIATWGQVFPQVARHSLSGPVQLKAVRLSGPRLQLGGEVLLQALRIELATDRGFELRGALHGKGDRIRVGPLRFEAGGQQLELAGTVRDPFGELHLDLHAASVGVLRANALLTSLTLVEGIVHGPMELTANLRGSAAAGSLPLYERLRGDLTLDLGRGAGDGREGGRLQGVSILREVFGDLAATGEVVRKFVGVSEEDFYSESFERLNVDFSLGDGRLRTEKLSIVYRFYGAELAGDIILEDHTLDMTGKVEIGGEFVAGLPLGFGALVIPIASIQGSVADPQFSVSKKVVRSLVRQVITSPLSVVPGSLGRRLPGVSPQPMETGDPGTSPGNSTDGHRRTGPAGGELRP